MWDIPIDIIEGKCEPFTLDTDTFVYTIGSGLSVLELPLSDCISAEQIEDIRISDIHADIDLSDVMTALKLTE